MRVSYLTDIETMKTTLSSDIYTLFTHIHDDAYLCAFANKSVEGNTVVQVGSNEHIEYAQVGLVHSISDVSKLKNEKKGVIIRDESEYKAAKGLSDVNIIAIFLPSDARIAFVKELVDSEEFDYSKDHWLYGVENPAELSMYRNFFTSYLSNRMSTALCASCYFASRFGVSFSWNYGVFEYLHQTSDFCKSLGMSRNYNHTLNKEQHRMFLHNQEMVRDFSKGKVARSYESKIRDILDGRSYEAFDIL